MVKTTDLNKEASLKSDDFIVVDTAGGSTKKLKIKQAIESELKQQKKHAIGKEVVFLLSSEKVFKAGDLTYILIAPNQAYSGSDYPELFAMAPTTAYGVGSGAIRICFKKGDNIVFSEKPLHFGPRLLGVTSNAPVALERGYNDSFCGVDVYSGCERFDSNGSKIPAPAWLEGAYEENWDAALGFATSIQSGGATYYQVKQTINEPSASSGEVAANYNAPRMYMINPYLLARVD